MLVKYFNLLRTISNRGLTINIINIDNHSPHSEAILDINIVGEIVMILIGISRNNQQHRRRSRRRPPPQQPQRQH